MKNIIKKFGLLVTVLVMVFGVNTGSVRAQGADTTPSITVSSTTALIGTSIIPPINRVVARNVSFSFTLKAGSEDIYVSSNPNFALATSTVSSGSSAEIWSTGLRSLITTPTITSTDVNTQSPFGYYHIPAGSSRNFAYQGVIGNTWIDTPNLKTLIINKIYYSTNASFLNPFQKDKVSFTDKGLENLRVSAEFNGANSTTPSITVLSPNGGESYKIGTTNFNGDWIPVKAYIKNAKIGSSWVYLTERNDSSWRSGYFERWGGAEGLDASIRDPYLVDMGTQLNQNNRIGKYYILVEWTDSNGKITQDFSDKPFAITSAPATSTQSSRPLACGTLGDVNGDGVISTSDIDLIRSIILKTFKPSDMQSKAADVTGEGNVSTLDVTYLRRYILGLGTKFPGCANPSSGSTRSSALSDSSVETNNPCYTFNTNLQIGSIGPDVQALQKLLINESIDIPSVSSGKDKLGYFGTDTSNALMIFQKSIGLPGSGFFGPLTREVFNKGGCATDSRNASTTSATNTVKPPVTLASNKTIVDSGERVDIKVSYPVNTTKTTLIISCPTGVTFIIPGFECNKLVSAGKSFKGLTTIFTNKANITQDVILKFYISTSDMEGSTESAPLVISVNPAKKAEKSSAKQNNTVQTSTQPTQPSTLKSILEYVFTPTKTTTPASTSLPSPTYTPPKATYTPTYSPTYSTTPIYTSTPSPAYTSTPTPTPTYSPTSTYTTPVISTSPTPTYTTSPTYTSTPTSTYTPPATSASPDPTTTTTPSPVPAVVTLTSNTTSITTGGYANLSWSSSGVTSCTNDWGSSGTSGSIYAYPNSSVTYTLTCLDSSQNSIKKSVYIQVNPVTQSSTSPSPSSSPSSSPTSSVTESRQRASIFDAMAEWFRSF